MRRSNENDSKRRDTLRTAAIVFSLLAGWSSAALAQSNDRRIAYQGQLTGATSSTTVQFRIFDGSGTPVWGPEMHVVTPDAEGRFVAVVGITGLDVAPADGTPDLDQLPPDDLELEVAVEDAGGGSMTILSPRQKLFAAFHASTTSRVLDDGVATAAIQDQAVTTDKLADDAIDASKIADGTITDADVAPGGLTGASIADSTLTGADILDGSINSTDIGTGQVSFTDLGSSVLTARFYRQNDILLRIGPCPAGFSDRTVASDFGILSGGVVNEGQESLIADAFATSSSGFIGRYLVRICRCAQSVCNQ